MKSGWTSKELDEITKDSIVRFNPNLDKVFEEISVCPYCNSPTEERFSGDEGWTFCTEGCGCLEGDKTVYKFICPDCEDICDEEICNCK